MFRPGHLQVGGDETRIHMLDVSSGGAKIHSPKPLATGTNVLVSWDDQVKAARVAWSAGAKCGLRFNLPLDAGQVAQLLAPA